MSKEPGKRKAEDALWEQHKAAMKFFFVEQNKTLEQVREVMGRMYGFQRTLVFHPSVDMTIDRL